MTCRLLGTACVLIAVSQSTWAQDEPIQSMTNQKYDVPWLLFQSQDGALDYKVDDVISLIGSTVYPESWDDAIYNSEKTPDSDKGMMRATGPAQVTARNTKKAHAAITNLLKTLRRITDDRRKAMESSPAATIRPQRGSASRARKGPKNPLIYTVPGDPQEVSAELAELREELKPGFTVKAYLLGDLIRFNDVDHINESVDVLHGVDRESWAFVGGYAYSVPVRHLEVVVFRQTPTNHIAIEEMLEKIRKRQGRTR